MRGDRGDTSLVSAMSHTTSVDIANIFASMLISKQPDVYVGLFGDNLVKYSVNRKQGILATARDIFNAGRSCGAATEHGIYLFFRELIKYPVPISNIIVFSDMVIGEHNRWYGTSYDTSGGSFPELFKEFRRMYPATKVVSVDIHQTSGTTVFNKNMQVSQVAGWSDKIFDVISSGTAGYKAIIEEIEKIVI